MFDCDYSLLFILYVNPSPNVHRVDPLADQASAGAGYRVDHDFLRRVHLNRTSVIYAAVAAAEVIAKSTFAIWSAASEVSCLGLCEPKLVVVPIQRGGLYLSLPEHPGKLFKQ